MPESSPIAGPPIASAATSALPSAFSANVDPTSGPSSTDSASGSSDVRGDQHAELPQLVSAARRQSQASPALEHLGLRVPQALDSRGRERQQIVEVGA